MSDTTPHLGLPLIAASQAQKHVTHNEALGLLDALVQLACLDKDLTAPPTSPAEGDRYLVVTANPGGAWAGLAGQVVRYADGVWTGSVPRAGWFAYVVDEADLYVFDGAAWTSFRRTQTGSQSLSRLGINTDADSTNRLAVKADAALLSWDDVTPGSGDMRITVNKKASAGDAGFVFQTGYASRALFGTLGGDDVVLKTSPDGAAFATAFTAAAATGVVAFAQSPTAPTPAVADRSAKLATTGFVAASVAGLVFGQCRLSCESASRLVLRPCDGNLIWINRTFRSLPAAGVGLANTGLSAGSLLYVYAYWTGTAVALEAAATGHAADDISGHRVKADDPTRTLVGLVYTDAGSPGTFVDTPTKRFVASHFNRIRRALTGPQPESSTGSTTAVELNAAARVSFVLFANETCDVGTVGWTYHSSGGASIFQQVGIDARPAGLVSVTADPTTFSPKPSASRVAVSGLAEGVHTATPMASTSTPTAYFVVGVTGCIG